MAEDDVAAVVRQGVDLLGPDIAVEVTRGDDVIEQFVWPLTDGERSFSIWLDTTWHPVTILGHVLETLAENVSETKRFRGMPFPACPGHPHPASVVTADTGVEFRCPATSVAVGRIAPIIQSASRKR
jgi:hypothetical protein